MQLWYLFVILVYPKESVVFCHDLPQVTAIKSNGILSWKAVPSVTSVLAAEDPAFQGVYLFNSGTGVKLEGHPHHFFDLEAPLPGPAQNSLHMIWGIVYFPCSVVSLQQLGC